MRSAWVGIVVILSISQISCSRAPVGPKYEKKVPLTKVTGTVTVDGQPAEGVYVMYTPTIKIAEERPQVTSRFFVLTNSKGGFTFRCYTNGDGVPAGEYALTFKWLPIDRDELREKGEVDKLGKQYSNLTKPFKTIEVKDGEPLDLGTIELETKSDSKKSKPRS